MATNPVEPEPPEQNQNPLAVAPANKPATKPDDRLTDDSPIAPKDKDESPREQRITDTDPHRDLHEDEDDDAFNEFRNPGEDMDLHGTHDPMAATGLSTGQPGTERFRPVPVWAIAGCGVLIAWAFLYLGAYSGGFQGDVFTAAVNYHPVSGPPVDPNSPEAMAAAGAKVFTVNCTQCHQASGLGQAGQYPPLVGSEWVLGDAPRRLTQILLHGIQGTIHVKGEVYNNQMPAWNATLTDKQIAQVLTYVRGKLGGNSAGPITRKGNGRRAQAHRGAQRFVDGSRVALHPARSARRHRLARCRRGDRQYRQRPFGQPQSADRAMPGAKRQTCRRRN